MAVADEGRGEAKVFATIPNSSEILLKQLKRLGPPDNLIVCYEAGPTGYGLYRDMKAAGILCYVVAPSLVPDQTGKRIKTDRRDAVKLAHYLRSGDLTPVYVPDETGEAIRGPGGGRGRRPDRRRGPPGGHRRQPRKPHGAISEK